METNTIMKKSILTIIAVAALCVAAQAQAPTTFGIGTGTENPNGTLHVHSSHNYIPDPGPGPGIEPPIRDDIYGEYYTTLRLTNTASDSTLTDGFLIKQYNQKVTVSQLENETFTLENHLAKIILSPTGRIGFGDTVGGEYKFNVGTSMRVSGNQNVVGTIYSDGGIRINNTNIKLNTNGTAYFSTYVAIGSGIHFNADGGASFSNNVSINSNNIRLYSDGSASFSNHVSIGNGFYCSSDGSLKVKSLRVTLTDWSDFVFDDGYNLRPLGEVERYIEANRHLPDIPSAQEVEENGVDVGEMNKLLLQKVEELTLYIIDLQKQIDELKSEK